MSILRKHLIVVIFALCFTGVDAAAQKSIKPFPRQVFTAKTVAIVNHTHTQAVEDGAVEALKRWGHFTVVDDPDTADLVLTFDKKSEHESRTTEKENPGKAADSGFSMTFGSSLTMKAVVKGSDAAFYSTTAGDTKKKGGGACVLELQQAYLADH